MVIVDRQSDTESKQGLIELRPNCSLSWRGNLYLVAAIALVSSIISISFALVGAWLILPFAGLEVILLFCVIYHVSYQAQRKELIAFLAEDITVERGKYKPENHQSLLRAGAYVSVTPATRPMDLSQIEICEGTQSIAVGEFLNEADLKILIEELKGFGLHSRLRMSTQQEF